MMIALYVLLCFWVIDQVHGVVNVHGVVRSTGMPWIYQPTYLYGRFGFLYNVVTKKCIGNISDKTRSETCTNDEDQKWMLRRDNRIQAKSPLDRYFDPWWFNVPEVGTQLMSVGWDLMKDDVDANFYAHFPEELPMVFELHLLYHRDLCVGIDGDARTADNQYLYMETCGMNLETGDRMWQYFPACDQTQTAIEFVIFDDEISNSRLRRNDKLLDNVTSTCEKVRGLSRVRLYISKPTGNDYTVNLTVSSDLPCDKIVVMGKVSDNIDLVAVTYKPSYSKCSFHQATGDICQYSCKNDFKGIPGACDEVFVNIPMSGGSICEAAVSSP